jgi:hypothetical protein
MDLHATISKSIAKDNLRKITDYVGNSATRFKVLVEVYQGGPYRVTQRAAHVISQCVEKHPALATPHLRALLTMLEADDVPVAIQRNTLRLLQYCDIPRRFHGTLIDRCFCYLQDRSAPIAVRAFSMTVLERLIENEPDLKKELQIILEDELPYASPAFVSRARKILQKTGSQRVD